MARAVGIVAVAFGDGDLQEHAARAAELGFDHIDAHIDAIAALDGAPLPIPIADHISGFDVADGCTALAPFARRDEDKFDETVALFRAHPGARLEPGPGTSAGSIEKVEALVAAVPGLRLTLDTGHVATWGEDPIALLRHADHVQFSQAARRQPQLHPDEGGDVDFAAVLAELDRLDYQGLISIEYFDLPEFGWTLDDPVAYSVALAAHVRALMH